MHIKSLIIGLGQIGMGYDLAKHPGNTVYTHAKSFAEHPDYELVAGVDPSEKQRNLFQKHFNCKAYSTITDALSANIFNLIVVATPTQNHLLAIKEVLSHTKPKAILCEKPLAYDIEEGKEILDRCESAGVKLFVNYMRRADPGCIEIKAKISSGVISTPVKAIVWYSKGIFNNGSHFFNLLEFWLGPFSSGKIIESGRFWNDIDPEPDLHAVFERGSAIFMAAWEESFSHCAIELLSPAGRLSYQNGGELIDWQSTRGSSDFDGYVELDTNVERIPNGMSCYQLNVANQLSNAIAGRANTLCTGRESLITLQSINQLLH